MQESEKSSEQMRRSMLEQTEADEWDELTPATRIGLLGETMDESDDLSEEEARWLKDESEQALEDLKDTFKPAIRAVMEAYKPVMESMQTLAELTEDIENNGE